MNNIEKLAIEAGFDVSQGEITVGDYGNRWDVSEQLEAFAKALQSSEPVAWYDPNNFIRTSSKKTETEYAPLFTLPSSTISLEEHNKRIAELEADLAKVKKSSCEKTDLLDKAYATNKTLLDALSEILNGWNKGVIDAEEALYRIEAEIKAIADAEVQPPCDNDHVAEGCEKFKEGVSYER